MNNEKRNASCSMLINSAYLSLPPEAVGACSPLFHKWQTEPNKKLGKGIFYRHPNNIIILPKRDL